MTAKGRITCRRKFFFFAFSLEGYMKRITITTIAALLTLWMVACGSLGTGSGQGEKNPAGGPNASQNDNRPTPGAQGANQQVADTQGAQGQSNAAKAPGTNVASRRVKVVKHRGRGAGRLTVYAQQVVNLPGEFVDLRIIETQDVAPVVVGVMQPVAVISAQPVAVIEQPVQPAVIVDVNETIVRPQAPSVY